jgi:hypothetical protein
MEEAELIRSQIFKEHAVRFMKIVDDLVDSMDQPKTGIQQTLKKKWSLKTGGL